MRFLKLSVCVLLLFGISLCIIPSQTFAQKNKIPNNPKYDKPLIHFGFNLGVNVANFKLYKAPDFYTIDTLYIVDNIKQTGFNLGIITDMRLGEHFNLRFIPSLIFAQRNLDYTFYDTLQSAYVKPIITKQIESTFLELPLSLKFKSKRVGNMRVYAIVGGQYMIDVVSQAKVQNKDKQFVKLERKDYGYHIGSGFDFYMEEFKLSIEMKMYNGMNNLLVEDPSIYSSSLSSLKTKMFYLSFFFE